MLLRKHCDWSLNDYGAPSSCNALDLQKCRGAIIASRGSLLERPCFCETKTTAADVGEFGNADADECMNWLHLMLPANPCIGLVLNLTFAPADRCVLINANFIYKIRSNDNQYFSFNINQNQSGRVRINCYN